MDGAARLDNSFNFETRYIRGLAKMKTRVGLALAVMMALALGQVRAGRAERMRSLVGAVSHLDTGRLFVWLPTSPLDPAPCRQRASGGHRSKARRRKTPQRTFPLPTSHSVDSIA